MKQVGEVGDRRRAGMTLEAGPLGRFYYSTEVSSQKQFQVSSNSSFIPDAGSYFTESFYEDVPEKLIFVK